MLFFATSMRARFCRIALYIRYFLWIFCLQCELKNFLHLLDSAIVLLSIFHFHRDKIATISEKNGLTSMKNTFLTVRCPFPTLTFAIVVWKFQNVKKAKLSHLPSFVLVSHSGCSSCNFGQYWNVWKLILKLTFLREIVNKL